MREAKEELLRMGVLIFTVAMRVLADLLLFAYVDFQVLPDSLCIL
jgi:hypothetical protein